MEPIPHKLTQSLSVSLTRIQKIAEYALQERHQSAREEQRWFTVEHLASDCWDDLQMLCAILEASELKPLRED